MELIQVQTLGGPLELHFEQTIGGLLELPSSGSRVSISLGSTEGCDLILLTQVHYHLNPGQNGCLLQAA